MEEIDYIVVGFGIAGLCFVNELERHNKTFKVFEDTSQVSSLVAGGTYNPLVLKRYTPVWNGTKQLSFALPYYEELGNRFKDSFDIPITTKKIFSSIEDQNNWVSASDNPAMSIYMNPKIFNSNIEGVKTEFGFGELSGTGWVDLKKLISTFKNYLKRDNIIVNQTFDYANLELSNKGVCYKNIKAKKIIFAEGYGIKKNPYFNYLPLNGTKGEVVTIHATKLKLDSQIKSSAFILPLTDDCFKVGATFNWSDKTSVPTEEGKIELVEKLKKIIQVPFEVVDQSAGIRPTVKDRRPLVGIHQEHENCAVLNGLGTRGVMIAPTVASALYNLIENNIPLDSDIDISRFSLTN